MISVYRNTSILSVKQKIEERENIDIDSLWYGSCSLRDLASISSCEKMSDFNPLIVTTKELIKKIKIRRYSSKEEKEIEKVDVNKKLENVLVQKVRDLYVKQQHSLYKKLNSQDACKVLLDNGKKARDTELEILIFPNDLQLDQDLLNRNKDLQKQVNVRSVFILFLVIGVIVLHFYHVLQKSSPPSSKKKPKKLSSTIKAKMKEKEQEDQLNDAPSYETIS